MKSRLIAIVGPTASGKTEVGVRLAERMDGAVVSADSRQVYRGMDIGTAKMKDAAGVNHYLLGVREPDDPLTLAEWQAMAFEAIDSLIEQGTTPLLVGGTMLYVDSVVRNYDIPQVEENVEVRKTFEREDTEQLYDWLVKLDPAAREFVEPQNKRRIIRALEVMAATQKPFSEQRKERPSKYDVTMIGLFPGWKKLEDNIRERAKQMLADGLLDETKKLVERYGRDLPLLQTINYKQALAVLDREMTEEEASEEMVRANLRYAKRQMSWWRGREEIKWLENVDEAVEEVSL